MKHDLNPETKKMPNTISLGKASFCASIVQVQVFEIDGGPPSFSDFCPFLEERFLYLLGFLASRREIPTSRNLLWN